MSKDDTTNDGGPAFPTPPVTHGASGGMSLHDWYAGQALAALAAALTDEMTHAVYSRVAQRRGLTVHEVLAANCQITADAMLAARKKRIDRDHDRAREAAEEIYKQRPGGPSA